MGDNASLDDFLGGESNEESAAGEAAEPATDADSAEPAEDTASTDATAATDEPEPEAGADVEPATTTYAWDGAGTPCETCGETVERRWQGGGGLVCVECKDWDRP